VTTMNANDGRIDFESRARQVFDASVESLDGRTRSRLTQARHAALAETARRRSHAPRRGLVPLAAASVAVIAALLLWRPAPDAPKAPAPVDVEFEIALAGDDLDLVSEELGFYALVESQVAATGGVG